MTITSAVTTLDVTRAPFERLLEASVAFHNHLCPGVVLGVRVICIRCGEGVNYGRELTVDGSVLCRACAGDAYYVPLGREATRQATPRL